MTSGGRPFGAAKPRNFSSDNIVAQFLEVGTSGNFGIRCGLNVASTRILPAASCARNSWYFADAHVERSVQHVDHHLAAAFMGHDGSIDLGCRLELFGGLAFERGGVGGAPAAALGLRMLDEVFHAS